MCNIRMIRTEPGLVSIPLEKAVYCENCTMVVRMAPLIPEPWDPGPVQALALAA